jgi:hypothetical protein
MAQSFKVPFKKYRELAVTPISMSDPASFEVVVTGPWGFLEPTVLSGDPERGSDTFLTDINDAINKAGLEEIMVVTTDNAAWDASSESLSFVATIDIDDDYKFEGYEVLQGAPGNPGALIITYKAKGLAKAFERPSRGLFKAFRRSQEAPVAMASQVQPSPLEDALFGWGRTQYGAINPQKIMLKRYIKALETIDDPTASPRARRKAEALLSLAATTAARQEAFLERAINDPWMSVGSPDFLGEDDDYYGAVGIALAAGKLAAKGAVKLAANQAGQNGENGKLLDTVLATVKDATTDDAEKEGVVTQALNIVQSMRGDAEVKAAEGVPGAEEASASFETEESILRRLLEIMREKKAIRQGE